MNLSFNFRPHQVWNLDNVERLARHTLSPEDDKNRIASTEPDEHDVKAEEYKIPEECAGGQRQHIFGYKKP